MDLLKSALTFYEPRKKIIWWTAGTLLIIIVVFIGLKPKHKPAESPRPVEIGVSESRDVPIYIESFGTLAALNNVNISPQVTGQIKEAHFTEGDFVKKDAPLFTINPDPYKAELEKAKAQLLQDEANLKLKKDTLERNKKLITSNLISEQDFEKYNTDVSAAEAQVSLDKATVDLAKINLDYCYIKSPIDGIAGKRLVDPGNIVSANSNTTLVNIKTIDHLYIDFTIPERYLPRLREAMLTVTPEVNIIVTGDSKGPYKGALVFVDNSVNNSTGTVLLRAKVDNSEKKLWPGQFVSIRLILGIDEKATIVPFDAVSLGQKGPYLFVIKPDNTAELRFIKTGSRQNNSIVVAEGVKPGERVVTKGQLGLSPGRLVIDMPKPIETETK